MVSGMASSGSFFGHHKCLRRRTNPHTNKAFGCWFVLHMWSRRMFRTPPAGLGLGMCRHRLYAESKARWWAGGRLFFECQRGPPAGPRRQGGRDGRRILRRRRLYFAASGSTSAWRTRHAQAMMTHSEDVNVPLKILVSG